MDPRKLLAEALGTALLVFVAVGVATLTFGYGLAGESVAAGVLTTAMAFGLVLLVLAYALGPISGCHVNPAVTLGFLAAGRISAVEAGSYVLAQVVGGVAGAAALVGIFSDATGYSVDEMGLGTNGYDDASMIELGLVGAFLTEAVLTGVFVLVVLAVTRKAAWPQLGGVAIGLALVAVHLIGIPLTGTSVNPARSIGPALFVGDTALEQLWVFIVAPLVGGLLAALLSRFLHPGESSAPETTAAANVGTTLPD